MDMIETVTAELKEKIIQYRGHLKWGRVQWFKPILKPLYKVCYSFQLLMQVSQWSIQFSSGKLVVQTRAAT